MRYLSETQSELDAGGELTDKHVLGAILFFVLLGVGALIAWLINNTLEDAAQISNVVGGVGTVVLSLLGAAAGLWWFLHREPLRPRLNIEQEVLVLPGPSGMHLLQVFARLENVGEIPIEIREWRIWVCPLDPLPEPVSTRLLEKSACVDTELGWEYCAGRRIQGECFDEIRLRTGEVQETIASVVVPKGSRAVRIYSFFPHPALNKPGEDRGWTRYSIINLEENVMQDKDKATSTRTEVYREPVTPRPIGPTERKDETYREPKPQGGGQGSGKQ